MCPEGGTGAQGTRTPSGQYVIVEETQISETLNVYTVKLLPDSLQCYHGHVQHSVMHVTQMACGRHYSKTAKPGPGWL